MNKKSPLNQNKGSIQKSFSNASIHEIKKLALMAGKQARNNALDAELEIRYTDEEGNTVIDRKLPNGKIETTFQGQTDDY